MGNVDSITSATGNIQAAYSAFNGDGQAAGDVGLYNAQVNAMLFSLYSALDGPVGPAPDYSQTSMEQRLDVLQTYTVPGVELSGISIYLLGYNSSKHWLVIHMQILWVERIVYHKHCLVILIIIYQILD